MILTKILIMLHMLKIGKVKVYVKGDLQEELQSFGAKVYPLLFLSF